MGPDVQAASIPLLPAVRVGLSAAWKQPALKTTFRLTAGYLLRKLLEPASTREDPWREGLGATRRASPVGR